LTLKEVVEKKDACQGILEAITSEEVIINLENKKKGTLTIKRSLISKARLAIKI
jgi:ribosome maturation factor RimP